ncbi:MAG TPA: antimicrobial peptide resistance and lipid A acylation PagP [Paraburkholderia sp.]|jgi:palmitoyl transferase
MQKRWRALAEHSSSSFMKSILRPCVAAGLLSTASFSYGSPVFTCDTDTSWLKSACERTGRVADQGSWDLYLFGYGYHFDRQKTEQEDPLNARSYGAGAGKHWTDASGNQDLLFAFAFLDSHDHVEPVVGYARQWYTPPVLGGLSLGAGFAAGITARDDILHYIPVPIAAPVASLRYRRASIMATVIPRFGGIASASVVLTWVRFEF